MRFRSVHPTRSIAAVALVAVLAAAPASCGSDAAGDLELVAADRTSELTTGGQTMSPEDPREDLLLVVEVGGLTYEEFEAVAKSANVTHVGPTGGVVIRRPSMTRLSRVSSGENVATLLVVVTVPRSAERYEFHLDGQPPLRIDAPPMVYTLDV